jgi:hypothetical protein
VDSVKEPPLGGAINRYVALLDFGKKLSEATREPSSPPVAEID